MLGIWEEEQRLSSSLAIGRCWIGHFISSSDHTSPSFKYSSLPFPIKSTNYSYEQWNGKEWYHGHVFDTRMSLSWIGFPLKEEGDELVPLFTPLLLSSFHSVPRFSTVTTDQVLFSYRSSLVPQELFLQYSIRYRYTTDHCFRQLGCYTRCDDRIYWYNSKYLFDTSIIALSDKFQSRATFG